MSQNRAAVQFAIALGFVLSIGAVYLIDNYLAPIDQAEAYRRRWPLIC